MKKVTACLLILTMLLIMALPASAHTNNQNEGTVPVTDESIVIDGNFDDAYQSALVLNVTKPLRSSINLITDDYATGVAYLLVSEDYRTLYVYAKIFDIYMVEDQNDEEPWVADGFEVFIDPTNGSNMTEAAVPAEEDATLSPGGAVVQYRQNLNQFKSSSYRSNTTGAFLTESPLGMNDSFQAATGDPSWNEYYEVEFAIDLGVYTVTTFGGVTCGAGTQLGIQLMINDMHDNPITGHNVMNENSIVPDRFHKDDNPWVWRCDEWNYIVLGEAGYVPPKPSTPADGNKPAAPAQPPKMADGIIFAALALAASACCALAVLKKRER